MFVQNTVKEEEIQEAFRYASTDHGFPEIAISRETWKSSQVEFEEFLATMQPPYDPHKRIQYEKSPSDRRTRGQTAMTDFFGKIPKSAYE